MKKNVRQETKVVLLISLFICLFSFMGLGTSAETPSALEPGQLISNAFPDDAFRTYVCTEVLERKGSSDDVTFANAKFEDGDAAKIAICISIDVLGNLEIESLEGIQYFTNMTVLYCANCSNLKSLDVNGCRSLAFLYCHNTKIKELDVTNCMKLYYLSCYSCRDLEKLDARGCKDLETLNCNSCVKLKSLNVSGCSLLKHLYSYSCNNLKSLDASGCEALTYLTCHYCSALTDLNTNGCKSLIELY